MFILLYVSFLYFSLLGGVVLLYVVPIYFLLNEHLLLSALSAYFFWPLLFLLFNKA